MGKFLCDDIMTPPILPVAVLLAVTEVMEEDEYQANLEDSHNKAEAVALQVLTACRQLFTEAGKIIY
jgi:hypothetical protein